MSGALRYITEGSVTNGSSLVIRPCFSEDFSTYKYVFYTSSVSQETNMNIRLIDEGGIHKTSSSYRYTSTNDFAYQAFGQFRGTTTSIVAFCYNEGSNGAFASGYIYSPYEYDVYTFATNQSANFYNASSNTIPTLLHRRSAYCLASTDSFEGIEVFTTNGTMSATLKIYGVANS
tara:strand:- start:6355 stop:6879 length:525 start_codon:yes stop_codon:yes gene_type:complete